eukprot:CAMPEP_0202968546 /NCGR_PEP_ID=MMETSP1396-20130829/13894_1 /ASSEMBLY_ACC=CAM_ASM_000872 /TAXON_ID= /ORGANISM="Pseudokeronopsis sp., Strain Brazil" /LENGTH=112 /DNA_ID=CAMNT_0049694981 /DNA_START=331 /DNA_END=665 /DNA_ORIENTATION=+
MISREFFFTLKGGRYKILSQEEFLARCKTKKLKLTVAKQLRMRFLKMLEERQDGVEPKNSVNFSTVNYGGKKQVNVYKNEYEDCLEEEENEDFDEDLFIEQFAPKFSVNKKV